MKPAPDFVRGLILKMISYNFIWPRWLNKISNIHPRSGALMLSHDNFMCISVFDFYGNPWNAMPDYHSIGSALLMSISFKILQAIRKLPFEAMLWLASLILLAIADPTHGAHFSVCPLALAGFDGCPGCGLGRSVAFLFKGEFESSFRSHPLGIAAVIILSFRIIQLTKKSWHV